VRITRSQSRVADGCLGLLETRCIEPSPTLLADPLVQAQPKLRRRVGRPKGSKSRVMQGARVLGVKHFAFVHAILSAQDLAKAFHRYMAWSETTTDLRHV
jgi:hypothetical protein